MNILDSLFRLLTKEDSNKEEVPEGLCPNCWGRNEYGGKYYESVKNDNVDVNDVSSTKGWIQEYADKHLLDIKLQHKDDSLVCAKCKVSYRPE